MAIDAASRRQDGVKPLSPQQGSGGYDGKGVNLPTSTYENPGPTENIRGIEPNTNWGWESTEEVLGAPATVIEGYTRDAPFDTPDDSLGDTVGPGDPRWQNYDSSARNSHAADIPHDSFSAFGESYPANGGLDGLT